MELLVRQFLLIFKKIGRIEMIYIKKKNTPIIFADAKRKYEHYDELPGDVKEKLKEYLINEQGHLCAYCMSRITNQTSTIEHYIPRKGQFGKSSLSLDYRNLLAVCNNVRNGRGGDRHCDVSKGDKLISVNPCRETDINYIRYNSNGEILSDKGEFNADFNVILNLNNSTLMNNRKAALSAALITMTKMNMGRWSKDYLQKCLNKFENQDIKTEYVGIIIFELNKRLQRNT